MQGSLGKQVFLAGQIAASPKSQGRIDKAKVREDIVHENSYVYSRAKEREII